MTYRQEMDDLSRHLGQLLVDGGRVPAADLPAALGAHAAVVHLLRDVHGDITHLAGSRLPPHVAEAERNPVALLGHLLRESPTTTDSPLTDTLAARAESPAGERWRAVTRAATLAQHDWIDATPSTRPAGDAAWSEIADVAHLAEGLTVLRADLADSLAGAGRLAEAATMRRASQSGLRLVAHQVAKLAATGPLPAAPDLVPRPPDRVLVVQSPQALPEAFRRLSGMLQSAKDLSPGDVALIAEVAGHGAVAAAQTLSASGDPYGADLLRRHAEQLATVAEGSTRRVAALTPGDQRPLEQAQQVYGHLTSLRRRGESLTAVEASTFARRIPEVTVALSEAAHRQVRGGRWFTPAEGFRLGRPDWTVIVAASQEPRMLEALRTASAQAEHLSQNVNPSPTQSPVHRPPREVLPPALAARPTAPRPAHPRTLRR